MKAPKTRQFAVITWKKISDDGYLAVGRMATCGHDDEDCPRISASILHRDGSVNDAAQEAEHWDGEAILEDPIVCTCAR